MSVEIKNLYDNSNIKCLDQKGCFYVYEHQKDMSVAPYEAAREYFMQQMNVKKRQALCYLQGNAVKLQAGAMQWMSGAVEMESGVKGVGGFFKNAVKSAVTGETLAKPIYQGNGCVMLEPTYNYLLLEDVGTWGAGIVLDDGLFLACDAHLQEEVVRRQNVSSAVLGGEGLFNLSLAGQGIALLESPVPREELIEFNLNNDVVKIDGNMAIAWSKSLQFTVEKSSKSLIGSAVSGEGFVNVYRGTGKILMAPTITGTVHVNTAGPEQTAATSSQGISSSVASSLFNL